jgi:hypothetical protein
VPEHDESATRDRGRETAVGRMQAIPAGIDDDAQARVA